MQKILVVTTQGCDLRSLADGWTWECDTDNIKIDKPIGLSDIGHCSTYDCPLKAIADGWRLLGPPQEKAFAYSSIGNRVYYEWWFEKLG